MLRCSIIFCLERGIVCICVFCPVSIVPCDPIVVFIRCIIVARTFTIFPNGSCIIGSRGIVGLRFSPSVVVAIGRVAVGRSVFRSTQVAAAPVDALAVHVAAQVDGLVVGDGGPAAQGGHFQGPAFRGAAVPGPAGKCLGIVGALPAAAYQREIIVGRRVPGSFGQDAAEQVSLGFAGFFDRLVIDITLERCAVGNAGMRDGAVGSNGGNALRSQVRLAELDFHRRTGRCVIQEKLHITLGNLHVECAGYLAADYGVIQRCREVIGIRDLAESESGARRGYRERIAEGQIDGPHGAGGAFRQAQGFFGGAVHLRGAPDRAVKVHLQVPGGGHVVEEYEDDITALPSRLDSLGGGAVGVIGGEFEDDLRSRCGGVFPCVVKGFLVAGDERKGCSSQNNQCFFHNPVLRHYISSSLPNQLPSGSPLAQITPSCHTSNTWVEGAS